MGSEKHFEEASTSVPVTCVGSGRSFNLAGFNEKLDEISGYIISDIERFPEIPYWIIPISTVRKWWVNCKLGKTTKISRKNALELLK